MDGLLAWLAGLPPAILYAALLVIAAAENAFPPLPSDVVVAFGTWLTVRGQGSAVLAFVFTWAGNVAGAAAMYAVGRRHGADWIHRRFPSLTDAKGESRLKGLYARYGFLALVASRFLPGVRAIVPPFAGALQVPPVAAIGAMAIASGLWYGIIAWLAFKAGADWNELTRLMARSGRAIGVVAASLAAIAVGAWLLRRRRRTRVDP